MHSLRVSFRSKSRWLDFSILDWVDSFWQPIRKRIAPYETIFEEAREGIMVHEPDTGEMVEVNPRAREIFGYDQEDVDHLTVEDLVANESPYDRERAAQMTRKVLRDGPQTLEWKYRREDDSVFWGEVRLQSIQFRGARRILALVNDITERKKYEQALEAAEASARQVSHFKSSILKNLSHAVRTPLTAILGYADLLENRLEGEMRTFAAHIQDSGQRLHETYSGLVEVADLEASTRELSKEELDVVEVMNHVVSEVRPLAEANDLNLTFEPMTSACSGRFDRDGLRRIAEELLINAIRFTGPDGRVRVAVERSAGAIRVTVADTGPGIPESFQPEMFEAFAKAGPPTARTSQGSGIGLTITKGLVDLMGGTIEVDSEKGEGTEMRVRLPIEG